MTTKTSQEFPQEFQELAEGQKEYVNEEAIVFDPQKESDLKSYLVSKGIEKRETLESMNDKGITKKPRLSTIQVAELLNEEGTLEWALFDNEEGTRLALYMMFDGIYTQNQTTIKRYIFHVENTFTERQAEDVIYKLTNMSHIKELTNARHLIAVNNGVFNLNSKQLEPFSSEYIFTTKVSTDYIEDAPEPVLDGWNVDDWVKSISDNDKEIEQLLWQVVNDSLNGNYSRGKAIFFVGAGNNGKGTMQSLITNLVGADNVASLKVNEFDQRFKLALLEGKTVCIGDDVPAGVYIDDSSNFNSVVTADRVLIERKGKQPYSAVFRPAVIQSTNDMPRFRNKSNGTTRRLVIVPFKADFNGGIENVKIKEDYIEDKRVLEYVLHKSINLDFEKFVQPEATKIEMNKFILDNDPIADFKESVFDEMESLRIPVEYTYQYYKDFCDENGYKPVSKRRFANEFQPLLSDDWEAKPARWKGSFTEQYEPLQYDKNAMLVKPNDPTRCYVNTRLEVM